MIDDILSEGVMTEAHLRMLVEKIYVQETDGKLNLDIQIKAPFRTHLDVYENGTLTERYGALDFDWVGWRGCSTATGLRGKRLCRAAGLSGMRERVQSHDPLLERQRRVEYVCRGYHRNGKGYCSSHRIHEEVLDKAIWDDTEKLRAQYAAELKKVTQLQKQWALRKPVLDAHCLTLQKEILRLEQEVDALVMEKLNGDGGSSAHEIGT